MTESVSAAPLTLDQAVNSSAVPVPQVAWSASWRLPAVATASVTTTRRFARASHTGAASRVTNPSARETAPVTAAVWPETCASVARIGLEPFVTTARAPAIVTATASVTMEPANVRVSLVASRATPRVPVTAPATASAASTASVCVTCPSSATVVRICALPTAPATAFANRTVPASASATSEGRTVLESPRAPPTAQSMESVSIAPTASVTLASPATMTLAAPTHLLSTTVGTLPACTTARAAAAAPMARASVPEGLPARAADARAVAMDKECVLQISVLASPGLAVMIVSVSTSTAQLFATALATAFACRMGVCVSPDGMVQTVR